MMAVIWGFGFWVASVCALAVTIVVLAKGWLSGKW